MIGYVTLGTNDLDRARAFYDPLFESVGAKRILELGDPRGFTMYGREFGKPSVVITRPYDGEPAHHGNGNMVALSMRTKQEVNDFHRRALELGAANEGDPGFRGDP